jgi:hypothetical protein
VLLSPFLIPIYFLGPLDDPDAASSNSLEQHPGGLFSGAPKMEYMPADQNPAHKVRLDRAKIRVSSLSALLTFHHHVPHSNVGWEAKHTDYLQRLADARTELEKLQPK